MRVCNLAATALLGLKHLVKADIFFSDIRPRTYPIEQDIDIHVGQLISPFTSRS